MPNSTEIHSPFSNAIGDLQNSPCGFADSNSKGLSVSIIILNYNGADLLPACLDSLREAAANCLEVIVVDNGSTDDSIHVLANYSWVKPVRTERNLGSSGGYNLGFEHSTGEFV